MPYICTHIAVKSKEQDEKVVIRDAPYCIELSEQRHPT